MYPAHMPFPEKFDAWKASPFGTGPYRWKAYDAAVKVEYARNDGYFRTGLPYLDGIVITAMGNEVAISAFRAGKLDSANIDSTPIERVGVDVLKRDTGFIALPVTNAMNRIIINQRPPWTDPRVREAIDLATNRQEIVTIWLEGRGTPYAAPVMPPEIGGQYGISTEEMKQRPGFRDDKTQDLARAKQLLAQAGVDPGQVTVNILGTPTYPQYTEVFDRRMRALGFKTKIEILPTGEANARHAAGNYDLETASSAMHFDDPADYLAPWVVTGGAFNFGKWSDPEIDRLYAEQDKTLDTAKRKQIMRDLQEVVLKDRFILPLNWRRGFQGHMPYVKNYPPTLPFLFSPFYRWELVYLER